MGKRSLDAAVVLSSEDEDDDAQRSRRCGVAKSEPGRNAARKKSRNSRRASASGGRFLNKSDCDNLQEQSRSFLPSDLCEELLTFTPIPARRIKSIESKSCKSEDNKLWVDKYKPQTLEELSVHRKKVDEVKMWLKERLTSRKKNSGDNVLLVTGQAGIGKSVTVYVVASSLEAEIYEWKTPTPTLWQEYQHSRDVGLRYMSKLDDFEAFVERIQKYPLLASASNRTSKKPVVLLIDDLPMTSRRDSYGRLCKCLHWLVQSAQYPTIILITEVGKSESGNTASHRGDELVSCLERFGVVKVAFNPITTNSIKKVLTRICKDEKFNISSAWIDQITKGSGGDIRHAITTLQYFSLRVDLMLSSPFSNLVISNPKDRFNDLSNPNRACDSDEGSVSFAVGRDETLSLFHGLGKFLHNKRDTESAVDKGGSYFLLRKELMRFPLKMDSPEKIFQQAHGDASQVLDFLHENVLDFISEEAVADVSRVTCYFSDADCLLAPSASNSTSGRFDPGNTAQSVAASVAIRGVLFGNSQPSPSRWHSIRKPKLWQIEHSAQQQKKDIFEKNLQNCGSFTSLGLSVFVAEFLPRLRFLEPCAMDMIKKRQAQAGRFDVDFYSHADGTLVSSNDTEDLRESEDEIEDW